MTTTQLKNLNLLVEMMDADQIASYADIISVETLLSANRYSDSKDYECIRLNAFVNKINISGDCLSGSTGFFGCRNVQGTNDLIVGTYETGIKYYDYASNTLLPTNVSSGLFNNFDYIDGKYYAFDNKFTNTTDTSINRITIYESTDAKNWNKICDDAKLSGLYANYGVNLIKVDGTFYFASAGKLQPDKTMPMRIWYSTDLKNWDYKDSTNTYNVTAFGHRVVENKGKILITGQYNRENTIQYFEVFDPNTKEYNDRIVYNCKKTVNLTDPRIYKDGNEILVAYLNKYKLATYKGLLIITDDGFETTPTIVDIDGIPRSIVKHGSTYMICTYEGKIFSSIDRISWKLTSFNETSASLEGMAVIQNHIVAVSRYKTKEEPNFLTFNETNIDSKVSLIEKINEQNEKINEQNEKITYYKGLFDRLATTKLVKTTGEEIFFDTDVTGTAFKYRDDVTTDDATLLEVSKMSDKYTSLVDGCFKKCNKLSSITLGKNISTLKTNLFKDGMTNCSFTVYGPGVKTIDSSTFNSTYIISAEFPVLNTIYGNAFMSANGLKSVNFPSLSACGSLNVANSKSFAHMSTLSSFEAPNLLIIGTGCFLSTTKLQSLTLPKVTKIGINAFNGVSKLESIDFSENSNIPILVTTTGIEDVASNAFDNISLKVKIYVPSSRLSDWLNQPCWKYLVDNGKVEILEK